MYSFIHFTVANGKLKCYPKNRKGDSSFSGGREDGRGREREGERKGKHPIRLCKVTSVCFSYPVEEGSPVFASDL